MVFFWFSYAVTTIDPPSGARLHRLFTGRSANRGAKPDSLRTGWRRRAIFGQVAFSVAVVSAVLLTLNSGIGDVIRLAEGVAILLGGVLALYFIRRVAVARLQTLDERL
jgi:hypothetical protein